MARHCRRLIARLALSLVLPAIVYAQRAPGRPAGTPGVVAVFDFVVTPEAERVLGEPKKGNNFAQAAAGNSHVGSDVANQVAAELEATGRYRVVRRAGTLSDKDLKDKRLLKELKDESGAESVWVGKLNGGNGEHAIEVLTKIIRTDDGAVLGIEKRKVTTLSTGGFPPGFIQLFTRRAEQHYVTALVR